jgi:hypothetical protein
MSRTPARSPTHESRIDLPLIPAVALAQVKQLSPLFNKNFTEFVTELKILGDDTPRSTDTLPWHRADDDAPVPAVQPLPRHMPEIGMDSGHWLLIPGLANKRVDVMLLPKSGGRAMSGPHNNAIEQKRAGYIVFEKPLTEADLGKTMWVKCDGLPGRSPKVEPRYFAPCRTTFCPPQCWVDKSIAMKYGRVVIIGPDTSGNNDALGQYAWTFPLEGTTGYHELGFVSVHLRREDGTGKLLGARTYAVESLCRSQNVVVPGAEATDVKQYS